MLIAEHMLKLIVHSIPFLGRQVFPELSLSARELLYIGNVILLLLRQVWIKRIFIILLLLVRLELCLISLL